MKKYKNQMPHFVGIRGNIEILPESFWLLTKTINRLATMLRYMYPQKKIELINQNGTKCI
jgi:hypothetical protein